MEYVIIAIILFAVMYLGFTIGWFLANNQEPENSKTETAQTLEDLYCFECEIEMQVLKKNSRLYCSNCKLYHDAFP